MATAVVSGAAALVLEEHPSWSPAQVKGALRATLVDVPGAGGVIDAYGGTRLHSTWLDGARPEHAHRPGHGPDRLDPGELPARELPRRERALR